MNLHEECLLKYLLNPCDLMHSTELLKLNNSLIEKSITKNKFIKNKSALSYSANRI